MNTSGQHQQPVKEFRAGAISAAVWRNEIERNGRTITQHSVQLQKRYRDPESGEWRDSSSLFPNDLPKAQLLLAKAFEYICLKQGEEDNADLPTTAG